MIEEVLVRASRVVEVRIAQFRAFLALLLAVFGVQNFVWGGTVIKGPFLPLSLVSCSLALMFSLFVLISHRRQKEFPVTRMALVSIGVDATLVVLPISLFFTENYEGQAVLNQPSVFAMYLLVIASGLRFRRVASLGILVNGLVIVSLMLTEAFRSQTPEGFFDPVATLAVRQHFLLLASSALLAWLISSHIRTTTLLAAQTAQQATVDGLTGVYNRHHLRQKLEELCASERNGFHLLMTDVDHFKKVNDQLGHPAGDRVLTEVARRLQGALRPGDLLARYGGEEFCVVLTRIDDALAVDIGERLRAEICKTPMENRTITSSVGVSRWDGQEPISALLDRADKALYKAKESGRNRVEALWPNKEAEQQAG